MKLSNHEKTQLDEFVREMFADVTKLPKQDNPAFTYTRAKITVLLKALQAEVGYVIADNDEGRETRWANLG